MKKPSLYDFDWNIPVQQTRGLWNPSTNSETFFTHERTLKERLSSPMGGTRNDDMLADIGKGIALIMAYIEKKENEA